MSRRSASQNEEPDRYNTFFNPNMCHVCKFKDSGMCETCNQCYMITYCQPAHKQKDYPYHKQICAAMQKLLKSHSHLWTTVQLNLEGWIQSRKEFLHLIKTKLSRDLKPYEMQMIMFAKSCLICHQQVNIHPCQNCWSVNYCQDHADDFKSYHSSNCKGLELCLNLDLGLRCGAVPTLRFTSFPDKTRPIIDMHSFVEQYVRRGYYAQRYYQWLSADYFYSDYVSAPMTVYHGLQDVDLLYPIEYRPGSSYVVHIIAANRVEREYISHWELLLHLLREVKDLRIIFIGSELQNECDEVTVCGKCSTSYRQGLSFECYKALYPNYVDSEAYVEPNIIVVFQADISQWDALSESISKIRDQNCPLLLTTKSKLKSEQNINKIDEIVGSPLSILYQGENKFGSGKPYRDFETDSASYRNKYLVIYRNLFKVLPP